MHTIVTNTIKFHYNGDFSGPIIMQEIDHNRISGKEIEVTAEDLLGFVALIVRKRKQEALESMGVEELLGLKEES